MGISTQAASKDRRSIGITDKCRIIETARTASKRTHSDGCEYFHSLAATDLLSGIETRAWGIFAAIHRRKEVERFALR
jgi:hypothetical protein